MADDVKTEPDLRALLKKRREQDSSASTVRISYTLDDSISDEYEAVKAELDGVHSPFDAERRAIEKAAEDTMGAADTADVDRREAAAVADLEAKLAEVEERGRAVTVDLVFRACTPGTYQDLVNQLKPDEDEERMGAFLDALCLACYTGAEQNGKPVDLGKWPEIAESMNYGLLDAAHTLVMAMNRRTVQTPFSSKPSTRTR